MKKIANSIFLIGIVMSLQGCIRAQKAFLTVQVCVVDSDGITEFLNIMRKTAQEENLSFIDNSNFTSMSLGRTLSNSSNSQKVDIIDAHIEGDKGLGVTAGNLGLSPYQIALGFTEGSNPSKARELAKSLIGKISKQWRVDSVPNGEGVFPNRRCG